MRTLHSEGFLRQRVARQPRWIASLILASVVALQTACSSSNAPGAANSGTDSGTPGDSTGLVGTFIVRLVAAVVDPDPSLSTAAYTQFQGIVRDGPVNSPIIWQVQQTSGQCKLNKARAPLCDPACDTNSVCVNDGVCKANPSAHSVGDVTVTGLKLTDGSSTFTVSPSTSFNYSPSGTLQYPPADEGAAVHLATGGGDYAPFELSASGIAPLAFASTDAIPLQTGQPLTLEWAPKGAAGNSTMEIQVNVNHHGGTSANITCETEDDGSLVIPADLVTALMEIGYSGYPQVAFSRKSVGTATLTHGRVELQIVSAEARNLTIPGLTSCSATSDCPDGQTCLSTKQCG